ncbi:MAG: RNA methyltransferase [Gammaproteobacteria bacterium]|nr:RNA methyltransferase [Gammaproteobacteria bacterium]
MLTSVRNPRVKDVIKLRNRRHRDRERRFVVEGTRELSCAQESGLALATLYYCEELLADGARKVVDGVAAMAVECQPTSRPVFEKMSYRHTPDGVLGVAPMPDLELERLPETDDALWLVAVGIEKPGNLGAMLRTADAVGVAGMVVADPMTDMFNPNVVRASMGTLFNVPVAVANGKEVHDWLERRRIRSIVGRPDAAVEYHRAELRGAVAITVGSEHSGLDARWSSPRHEAVRIPMAGRADSLNAATAAAVLLFEACRQRREFDPTPR